MNKYIGISLALWLLASNAFAQGDRGVITGVVIDPDGNAVEGATVNAKNIATGAIVSAVSSAKGDFTISGLAAGNYDLATPTLGFTFRPYSRSGDRKSTRLNSSHVKISYAVFCLKKK